MDRKLALSSLFRNVHRLGNSLIMQIITPLISSIIFAIVLVVFGGLSRGFRKGN